MNFSHKTNNLKSRIHLQKSLWLSAVLFLLTAMPAVSGMAGRYCSDCHTMHYSQGGGALGGWGDSGPYNALLIDTCVGCHTGTNSGGNTPYVMSAAAPTYGSDTLAGGSFFWVTADEDKGHNIVGITSADSQPLPPGWVAGVSAADGSTPGANWNSEQITCAGTYGCHGTHDEAVAETAIAGGHHDNASGAIETPGTTSGGGYRMLVGVAGYEDADWEYTKSQSDHNQYKGVDGGSYSNATISSLCRRCHNNFHSDIAGSSPWLRHPIDFDMGSTDSGSEVRSFGPTYNPEVPVASTDVSARVSSVTFADDTIVTCLSCHRAHGSPYDKLLRWDYYGSAYVSATAGCAVCHTSKQ